MVGMCAVKKYPTIMYRNITGTLQYTAASATAVDNFSNK